MNILYIGSGKSAELIHQLNLNNYTIICVNNSWRLFNKNNHFDVWIHSGDFLYENYPNKQIYNKEISHLQYEITAEKVIKMFNINTNSPQHYLGYTIFFLGIYWIIIELKPEKISLLGFDHDYNEEKVIKWKNDNMPNIQNKFNNKSEKSIKEWSDKYFHSMNQDFFYGHGTPDPLRLGEEHLIEKFKQLESICEKLKIKLVNLSPVDSKINMIVKENL